MYPGGRYTSSAASHLGEQPILRFSRLRIMYRMPHLSRVSAAFPRDDETDKLLDIVHQQIGEMQLVRDRILQLENTHNQMKQR